MIDFKNEQQHTNDLYFRSIFSPMKNIYIDLMCLQDIKIGAMLDKIDCEAEYKYILDKMENYDYACDYSIENNFPVLEITDNEIEEHLHDARNNFNLSHKSPMTSFFADFPEFLDNIVKHNNIYDNDPYPSIIINTYPLDYNKIAKIKMITFFKKCNIENVSFINENLVNMDKGFYTPIELFIISDIKSFLEEKNKSAVYFASDGIFVPKYMLALAHVDKDFIKEKGFEGSPVELLKNTETTLNCCTNFTFFMREILTPKTINNH